MTYNVSTRHPIPEGCLTATCDLCGNGMYGGLADIYQSSEHGARLTRNLRLPGGGEYPAAQRASPSPRTRSRARSGPRICHPGRLRPGERGGAGRGRSGPGAADPERPHDWDGGGARTRATDSEGARSRSHEPAAVRPNLGLGWTESAHRWTGTTCRAAPLDCSE